MINKPKKYDEVQVGGDFTPIELGGHKGVIKNVEQYTSDYSGNTSLKVVVDTTTDDKQPQYFTELYNNDERTDKKWSSSAVKYVSLKEDDNCVKMLKSFITAVENSNANFTYDWDKDEKKQLIGKKVGLVFGLEEYKDQEDKVKTGRKLVQFRSIDKVDNVKIPKVKLLDGSFVEYEQYNTSTDEKPTTEAVEIELNDEDFPF